MSGGRTPAWCSPVGSGRRSSRTTFGGAGNPLRDRLGLSLRFHDLRHACVNLLLLDLGVPPHIVRQIAGHSDIAVTMKVYAHASLDEQRKALGPLSDKLG
ncbi:tyrosine-type recombinase/integrase [Kitasatospora sp. NPDC096128]|uniref:tyrosine-type recombinase/integrase n=1 Tax=Kitasatospora sp. NPDC096128 TaxID=3155547 RepID=UPI003327D29B